MPCKITVFHSSNLYIFCSFLRPFFHTSCCVKKDRNLLLGAKIVGMHLRAIFFRKICRGTVTQLLFSVKGDVNPACNFTDDKPCEMVSKVTTCRGRKDF